MFENERKKDKIQIHKNISRPIVASLCTEDTEHAIKVFIATVPNYRANAKEEKKEAKTEAMNQKEISRTHIRIMFINKNDNHVQKCLTDLYL